MVRGEVRGVAGEDLIGTLTVQQDRHTVVLRELHHLPLRVDARGRERLLLVPQAAVEILQETVGRRPHVVARRSRSIGRQPRVSPSSKRT